MRKTAKKGSFADYSKRRDKTTLDWNAIRRRNAEKLDQQIAEGIDTPETRRRLRDREEMNIAQLDRPYLTAQESDRFFSRGRDASTPKPRPSRANPNREKYLASDADVTYMVTQYTEEGQSPPAIAAALGIDPKTVVKHLKDQEVYDPTKYRHQPRPKGARTTQPKEQYL